MIVKVHSRGSGGGKGPVQYLLGRDGQREGATLLRGDPTDTVALIDSLKFSRRYTSGVLSFAESDLPENLKQELMDSFERALLPGLDADQYQCLWVEHQDKGRLELNFVVPNVELTSGKRLQPYYDRADRPRINAWKTAVNGKLGLHDPNDPANRQAITLPSDLPRATQEAARAITDGLLVLAGQGEVASREDVLRALRGHGFTIAREGKSFISIENPDGGRNIRLKGALYERDFRLGQELQGEIEAASTAYRERAGERVREALSVYQRGAEIKREANQRRYPRPQPELQTPGVERVAMDGPQPRPGIQRQRGGPLVDRGADRRQSDRDRTPGTNLEGPAGPDLRGGAEAGQEWPVHRAAGGRHGPQRVDSGRPQGPETGTGVIEDDRARAAAFERVRAATEQLRASAARVAAGLQQLADDVRAHLSRDSGLTAAGNELERTGGKLEQAAQRVIQQRERAAQQRYQGPSL